jgi:hypothetical protein
MGVGTPVDGVADGASHGGGFGRTGRSEVVAEGGLEGLRAREVVNMSTHRPTCCRVFIVGHVDRDHGVSRGGW